MARIELAMWANLQAEYTGWIMLVSGLLGATVQFARNGIAYFSILWGILIIIFEYPRSKRKKGTNVPRPYQEKISPLVELMGFIGRNYYIRFVAYTFTSIPLFFLLPTMLCGMLLLCASATYFAAALRGEQWKPIPLGPGAAVQSTKRVATSEPPSQPPPRAPTAADASASVTKNPKAIE